MAKIIGENQTKKALRKIPTVVNDSLRKSLSKNSTVFQKEAKSILKSKIKSKHNTKKLERSIKVFLNVKKMRAEIGPDGSATNSQGEAYHEWVEFGHYYKPYGKQPSVLRWEPGKFFMTSAYSNKWKSIEKDFTATMKADLNNYAKDEEGNVKLTQRAVANAGKVVGRV